MVVHEDQLPGHRVVKILPPHQGVGAKEDLMVRVGRLLVCIGDEGTLVEIVTHYQLYVVLF